MENVIKELLTEARKHGLRSDREAAFLLWVGNEVFEGREVDDFVLLTARVRELTLMFRNQDQLTKGEVKAVKLEWKDTPEGPEVILGDFHDDDGVRFSILHLPTCYRRGPWRLLVEIEDRKREWGCFDEQDQPMRYYHSLDRLKEEAQAIADVLVRDHEKKVGAK